MGRDWDVEELSHCIGRGAPLYRTFPGVVGRSLQYSGADFGALQMMEAEYPQYGGIHRQAAELETIAADAHHDRFVDLMRRSGLTAEQHAELITSTAFGPLAAALRRAEAYHHDPEEVVLAWLVSTGSAKLVTSPPCSATASTRRRLIRAAVAGSFHD